MRNADLLICVYFLLPNYAVMHMTSAISAHPAQFSDTFHRLSQTKQISHQTNAIFLVLSQTNQISHQTNAIFLAEYRLFYCRKFSNAVLSSFGF